MFSDKLTEISYSVGLSIEFELLKIRHTYLDIVVDCMIGFVFLLQYTCFRRVMEEGYNSFLTLIVVQPHKTMNMMTINPSWPNSRQLFT